MCIRDSDGDERFSPLPDVLLLDGGKTQLAAVRQVLDVYKRQDQLQHVHSMEPEV